MNSQKRRGGKGDLVAQGNRQNNEAGDLQPPGYYSCSCTEIVIELLAFLFIILFPAITGRYDLYPIVAPIAFIILIVIWMFNKSDSE